MRRLMTTVLMILFFCLSPYARADTDISTLLQGKINDIMSILQDKQLDKYHRDLRIKEVIAPVFSYQTMAKLSLGKKHWSALSQEQRNEFSTLFTERLQQSYLEKLDIYTDEKVTYQSPLQKGKQVHIPTTLISKDKKVEILYKFFNTADGWKIYDVEIAGVSVIQTYRSQFDGILREGTVDDLLKRLRSGDSAGAPQLYRHRG
jgi:phospholipid transport system substrate-binding protein